jgi:poly(3-hydroxybutyrate) depolymerase
MRHLRALAVVVLGLVWSPSVGNAQALVSLGSLRVGYNTLKTTTKPEGALKAQIDTLDREIAEATRLGRASELRRLFAKGSALLRRQPWTPESDYGASLVVRTDRVVADSSAPYVARLEQLWEPAIELPPALTAAVTIRRRPVIARPGSPGAAGAPLEVVKGFGAMEGVSRDLRDSPFAFEIDVADLPNGPYLLAVDVMAQGRSIGLATLPITLQKDLDDATRRLTAQTLPQAVRSDVLFPFERIRNVNRGQLPLGNFDVASEVALAEKTAAAARTVADPFAGRTGDMERHYRLEPANEIMPYRLYVPKAYDRSRAWPLIISLHGLGGTEDSHFDGYGGELPRLAEQHGYILAAPFGYRVDGSYGWGVGTPPEDPIVRRRWELSEADVMQVLAEVRRLYNVDPGRTCLMGHSMGAIGTWRIAAKYPEIWAALGLIAGTGQPATQERMRHIPQIVVHGDADATVAVAGSRTMVDALRKLDGEVVYIEVPGGGHGDVVQPNFSKIVEFFGTHQKKQ